MKIVLLVVGKTEDSWIKTGIEEYSVRVKRYVPFEVKEIPALRNAANISRKEWKAKEAEKILGSFIPGDIVVLLDEKGTEMSSVKFSGFINSKMNSGIKTIYFVVGGPFGFDDLVKNRANYLLSLSKMTFSHQMVRVFFTEQLYRAMTILKNESYHHE